MPLTRLQAQCTGGTGDEMNLATEGPIWWYRHPNAGMDAGTEDGLKMIAAELRGGNKPSLNEALGWIGSRVDDIYGASVGRLEDVWIDPGTGAPRWLLVKEGRFGGRSTLVPFSDATAGAGHVWVPYERDVVREAPQIEPGVPLTQQVEATLRNHYAANATAAVSHGSQPTSRSDTGRQPEAPRPTQATVRLAPPRPTAVPPPQSAPQPPMPPPRLPQRPPPPVQPPPPQAPRYEYPPAPAPVQAPPAPAPYAYPPPPPQEPVYRYEPIVPAPAPDPNAALAAAIQPGSIIEIELEGNLTITGELRQVRITPRGDGSGR